MPYLNGCYGPLEFIENSRKNCVLESPHILTADSMADHDRLLLCCLAMAENRAVESVNKTSDPEFT
jgi:hypothetical protein